MKVDFAGKELKCVKGSDLFEENSFYYCFADEGHSFWIHAPYLEEKFGVVQVKMSDESRDNFIIRNRYERTKLLPG